MTFSEETLTAHFGRIWPAHNDAFCELLVQLRRQFDGDLDRMLVLGIIGSRTRARGRVEGMSYVEFIARERREDEPAPINLQSIADSAASRGRPSAASFVTWWPRAGSSAATTAI